MSPEKLKYQEVWDNYAISYSFFDGSYFPAKLKMDLVKKYSQSTSICLDVGIANGIFSLPLASSVKFIDGIDISGIMLEKCRSKLQSQNITNIGLHKCSAEDLPFEKEQYDLVFSFATLVIIPNLIKSLNEIYRTLKTGKYAVLDFTGRNNLSRFYWENFYKSSGHFGINSFELSQLKILLNNLGFEILEIHSIGVLDQWKYILGVNKFKFLENITHHKNKTPDLDYQISRIFPNFANHWFCVLKKK